MPIKFPSMKRGLLEFVVLKTLVAEPMYASQLLAYLATTEFRTPEGTLHPLLCKLRGRRLLEQSYEESDGVSARKYYYLTDLGRTHMKHLVEYWKTLNDTLANITPEQIRKDRDVANEYGARSHAHTSTFENSHAPMDRKSADTPRMTRASTPIAY